MQNNVDLIRAILAEIRDREDLRPREVNIQNYDPLVVSRHVERLFDDGMIDGMAEISLKAGVKSVMVKDLTSNGHAFLASLESQDVWEQIKSVLSPSEIGRLSMKQLGRLAGDLAEKAVRRKLGLD